MQKNIILPEIADNVTSALIGSILVSVGDQVSFDQSIVEVETDKATSVIPSPYAGRVVEILVERGDELPIGGAIAVIAIETSVGEIEEEQAQEVAEVEPQIEDKPIDVDVVKRAPVEASAPVAVPSSEVPKGNKVLVPASPSVRRLARELGVAIELVEGTGPRQRISTDDVKKYAKSLIQTGAPQSGPMVQHQPLPDFGAWGEVRTEAFNRIREITAQSMTQSWQTIPQVTHFDQADITDFEAFRKKDALKAKSPADKLTVTAVLVKVIALALQRFEKFNASIDMVNKQVVYKSYYHVGIAVDTPHGLLVPVVKDADQKNIRTIGAEMNELALKAREKKITPAEMSGGNFTISNLGGLGGTNFTPIVYAPQVAILGVSRARIKPVLVDGEWQPRLIMPLSLSYDHRLIDGAESARFLRWICEALENPLKLLL